MFHLQRQSAEYFLKLCDFMDAAVFVYDADGMLMVNQAAANMCERPQQEILQKRFADLVHPDYRSVVGERIRLRLAGKEPPPQYEVKLLTQNGATKWIHYSELRVAFDGRAAIFGIAIDISPRKAMEKALEITEEKYKLFYHKNPQIYFTLRADLMIASVNDYGAQFLGYKAEELIGKSILEMSHRDDRANVRERFEDFLHSKANLSHWTYRKLKKDGTVLWVKENIRRINLDGQLYLLVVCQDVSNFVQVTRELRKSNERYRWIAEHSNDLIVIFSFEGRILYASPVCKSLIGYEPAEVLQKSVYAFLYKRDLVRVRKRYPSIFDLPAGHIVRCRIRCSNGDLRWFESSTKVIPDPQYRGRGEIIVTARDVSHRKKMEEDFLKTSKMESLSVLAGGLAHDFNNFLTAMISNITLAKHDADPESEIFGYLSDAEKAAYEAKALTGQLMTFAHGGPSEKKIIALPEFIKKSVQFILTGSNIRPDYLFPADLWAVEVDTGQFKQVIDNLVINAMQAMPRGGTILIRARNCRLEKPVQKEVVEISIVDQGEGILEKNLARIFDPYFTTKKNGTGLGLATCYAIIKKHGGNIAAASTPGVGTTFTITLPAAQQNRCAVNHAETAQHIDMRSNPKGRRVLLMDDDEKVLTGTAKILKRMGFDVHVAREGKETLALFRRGLLDKRPFDVVIMDLTIANGMGAKETIAEVKKIAPDAKVILSSGYHNDPAMENFKNYGFSGQIAKPYRVHELCSLINQIV